MPPRLSLTLSTTGADTLGGGHTAGVMREMYKLHAGKNSRTLPATDTEASEPHDTYTYVVYGPPVSRGKGQFLPASVVDKNTPGDPTTGDAVAISARAL